MSQVGGAGVSANDGEARSVPANEADERLRELGKARAAADFEQRQLEAADAAAAAAERAVEKAQGHLAGAEQALTEANAARVEGAERLAVAVDRLAELEG